MKIKVAALALSAFVFVGCNDLIPRDPHPERSPEVQVSCYRWNNDGITETECGTQTGVQPAPSGN